MRCTSFLVCLARLTTLHSTHRSLAGIVLAFLLFALAAISATPSRSAAEIIWKAEVADTSAYAAHSIDFDGVGNPHVLYAGDYNTNCKYTTKSGGIWTATVLDPFWTLFGMAVDPRGVVNLTHVNLKEVAPSYTSNIGGQWRERPVEVACSDNAFYAGSGIAVDNVGGLGVVYFADDFCSALDVIRLARRAVRPWDAPWTYETVADDDIDYPSRIAIGFGPQGQPHICYISAVDQLRYTTKLGGTWTNEVVALADQTPRLASIDVDASGRPHIAYASAANRTLVYAVKTGGVWTIETASMPSTRTPGQTSIGVSPNGDVWIGFTQFTPKYARRTASTWDVGDIDSGCCGGRVRLAISPTGLPGVAFGEDILKFAYPASLPVEDGAAKTMALRAEAAVTMTLARNPVIDGDAELAFDLPVAGSVAMRVYDASGRAVRSYPWLTLSAGSQRLNWDRRDERGELVAAGVYFLRVDAPSWASTSRLVLLR